MFSTTQNVLYPVKNCIYYYLLALFKKQKIDLVVLNKGLIYDVGDATRYYESSLKVVFMNLRYPVHFTPSIIFNRNIVSSKFSFQWLANCARKPKVPGSSPTASYV